MKRGQAKVDVEGGASMTMAEFGFKLNCAEDAVTPKALKRSVETFLKMLEEVGAQDWRISNLGLHSVDIAATPIVNDEDAKKSFAILSRVAALAKKNDLHSSDMQGIEKPVVCIVTLFKELVFPITLVINGAESTFTSESINQLSKLLEKREMVSFGHVCGIVDKLILQERHRSIGLIDEATSQRIDVRFTKELDHDVQGLTVGMTIDAVGLIQRSRDRINAERIRVIAQADSRTARIDELEGILDLNFTGGMSSVDFVSALRDCSNDEDGRIGGSL